MNDLKEKLNINDKFNKEIRTKKIFSNVKQNIPLIEDYNFMADVIQFPKFNKFAYLLVVVDLATDEFDFEPITETSSNNALKAFQKIVSRNILNIPNASITTDGGPEFKGVFNKYFYDSNVLHKTTLRGRHKQLANVDNLIKQISKLVNLSMNSKEELTGKVNRNWLASLPVIRTGLNAIRKKKVPVDISKYEYQTFNPFTEKNS
jgi:hypothetical protein